MILVFFSLSLIRDEADGTAAAEEAPEAEVRGESLRKGGPGAPLLSSRVLTDCKRGIDFDSESISLDREIPNDCLNPLLVE